MRKIWKNGLSGTALKLIAAASMLLDHIAYFFGFTGRVPSWFTSAGRLAAPLYLFCLAEGFAHTRSRRRYFLRIYLLSAAMASVRFFMQYGGIGVRGDGFYPQNSMLTTFALLMIVWQGMDFFRERRLLPGIAAVAAPLLWPFAASWLFAMLPSFAPQIGYVCTAWLPLWGMTGDTSLPVLVMGLLIYPLRAHRRAQAAWVAGVSILYHFVLVFFVVRGQPGFAFSQMFTVYVEWMQAFAVPLMLCYNGQRGRGLRAFFYAFYPGHIAALYGLSCLLYTAMR